jgi:hypothetical protein
MNRVNPFGQSSALLDTGALKEPEQTMLVPVYFPDRIRATLELTAQLESTAKYLLQDYCQPPNHALKEPIASKLVHPLKEQPNVLLATFALLQQQPRYPLYQEQVQNALGFHLRRIVKLAPLVLLKKANHA